MRISDWSSDVCSSDLDIGAGTGFLSFLARRLGAAHSTLIEYSEALELAQELARRNRIDGLTFIKGHSLEYKRKLSVDIVVTETLGNYALEENFLETALRSEEHTSELQSLMRISYAVFCLKKQTTITLKTLIHHFT